MESFLKKVVAGKNDSESHRYFVRFGKGQYNRRFLMSLDIGKEKLKIRTSFELANDLAKLANELDKNLKFSGKILTKSVIPGMPAKKKGGLFVYEVSDASLSSYPGAYYYLVDAASENITVKMKKALPKPGKDAEKIDDKFCALELNLKYLPQIKDMLFWDSPQGKKTVIEHDLIITGIDIPKNEKDPAKQRELAIRTGKIVRRINVDGKDLNKEYEMNA